MTPDVLGSFSGNFAGRTRHPEHGSVKCSERSDILHCSSSFVIVITQSSTPKNDRLLAVEKQAEQFTVIIAKSLKSLLFNEKADVDKMILQLCKGIAGLTVATSKRCDLINKGARDDLSKFVVKEMERVRKQNRLKKSEVYNALP